MNPAGEGTQPAREGAVVTNRQKGGGGGERGGGRSRTCTWALKGGDRTWFVVVGVGGGGVIPMGRGFVERRGKAGIAAAHVLQALVGKSTQHLHPLLQCVFLVHCIQVRRVGSSAVGGFAGVAVDGLALLERLESKLEDHPGQLQRAAVELAKMWRQVCLVCQ
jgi:hypothetical protein